MAERHPRDTMLHCSGEMAERFASFDWSSTPLGPADQWPASLRTTCAMMLRSRFPMILSWGDELVVLYNDAFIPTLGAKHPGSLGDRLATQFAEVWDEVGPMQRSVLAGGEAMYFEDLPLVIERGEGPEETFFTFSYSHVPDDSGPGGVLAVLAVTTGKVVGARRLALLNALAASGADVTSPAEALDTCADHLSSAGADLLHGAGYLADAEGRLALSASFGDVPESWPGLVEPDTDPGSAPVADPTATRLVAAAWRGGRVLVEPAEAGADGPPWLVALPVRARGGVAAVLLVAPHPLRPLDDDHRRFLDLLGDQVSQVVSLATARADEHARLEALAAIDKAKTELLSNVSHEFRTPLTLLLGPLEDAVTGRTDALDDTTLSAMHQGAHRLLRMVNDLLDIARIDAGGRVVDPEPTDVVELTEELLEPFRGAAARSGLSFDAQLDPTVGVAETDPRLWEKILLNLVSNAVKYTHEGGITVELAADHGPEGEETLVLRVADTGVGIPAEEVDRVFERFHRVAGTAGRSIEGTGLGLALVAEAAHAQGGTAVASSSPGEGSAFEVRLPLKRVRARVPVTARHGEPVDAAVAMALELAGELPGALTGVPAADAARAEVPLTTYPPDWLRPEGPTPTILVVDDNQAMRTRLDRVLGELGTVVTSTDGEQALAVLRHSPVDLVVTDVMMPRLDGVGLLRAIRADETLAPIPVVVLSARAGAEAATDALEIGADDYVVKPFTRTELLARCRSSLELARHRAHASALAARAALVAGVSHDMLTPLSVISSVLETLADPGLEPDLRVALSQRALPRTQELERLIRQFLDWSRISAGKPIATFTAPTHLLPLVVEVVDTHPGVEIDPGPASATVSCDAPRTQQILHNLLSNATRAARSGVRVHIRPAEDDGASRDLPGDGRPSAYDVVVTDDGPGISERVLPGLFAPHGPSDRTDGGSHGLGLFVSRETARAQGGDVMLEATGADGTSFVLRVPAEHR